MSKIALIVHGGAWRIDPSEHDAHLNGVKISIEHAWRLLKAGGSASHVVQQAVMLLENDPTFDAGIGSVLNRAGEIELDAMLMDGKTLSVGAIAGVQGIENAIQLASVVQQDPTINFLVGKGAEEYARLNHVPLLDPEKMIIQRELDRYEQYKTNPPERIAEGFSDGFDKIHSGGTVGAVALDQNGNIAAATSTGGTPYSPVGRVGDSPLIGCGTYADNETGGASATGHGERIMQVMLTKYATDLIVQGYNAPDACRLAIEHLANRVAGHGGLIMVDKDGYVGFAHNTPHMAVAWYDDNDVLQTYIKPTDS